MINEDKNDSTTMYDIIVLVLVAISLYPQKKYASIIINQS